LWRRLREILLASAKLCADETPVPVLDPGRGRTKTGYFWALSRAERPWAGPDPPGVFYAYAPGRGAVHGLRLIQGYRGIIHCDGYEAYKTMTRKTRADALSGTLAFCWSHLRRQFVKIEREASPAPAPVAHEALERIAQLYAVEKALRGRSDAERRAGRQAHARPLAAALKQWFEGKRDFPRTLTPAVLMDCPGIGRYRAVQAVAALWKLKGSRSVISASPAR
jgi:transposase